MSRFDWLLVGVICAEVVGSVLVARHRSFPAPPLANVEPLDPLTAADIKALAKACRTADDWARLADVYLACGFFSEAEACYRTAAHSEPDRSDRAWQWAFALERLGLLDEANREYERSVSLGHPQAGECWYLVGRNHLRLENVDAAREAFQRAPDQPGARYEIARLAARSGQYAEATKLADALTAEFPQCFQPWILRCRLESLTGGDSLDVLSDHSEHAQKALPTPFLREFERFRDLSMQLGPPREERTYESSRKTDQKEAGERRFRRATMQLERRPQDWESAFAQRRALDALFEGGNSDEAIGLLEDALEKAGPSRTLLINLGNAYSASGRRQDVIKAWRRALIFGSPSYLQHYYAGLAKLEELEGDKQSALRYRALASYAAGHDAFSKDQFAACRDKMKQALELRSDLVQAWFYLGESYRLLGQRESALKAYQRCLELDENHGRAIAGLQLSNK